MGNILVIKHIHDTSFKVKSNRKHLTATLKSKYDFF